MDHCEHAGGDRRGLYAGRAHRHASRRQPQGDPLDRLDDALASFDRAIALKPSYAEAFINRANALRMLDRFGEAVTSFDRAIALKPGNPEAFTNPTTIRRASYASRAQCTTPPARVQFASNSSR